MNGFMLTYISSDVNMASFEVVFLLFIYLIDYIYFEVMCFLLLQLKSLIHLLWQWSLKINLCVFPDKCIFGSSGEGVPSFSRLAKPE